MSLGLIKQSGTDETATTKRYRPSCRYRFNRMKRNHKPSWATG